MLCRAIAASVVVVAACEVVAWGQSASPTSAPAAAAGAPLSSGDQKIDAILDRLEEKGRIIKGLTCRLVYTHVLIDPVESRKVKEGTLLFARAEPNSRFLVQFDKMIADGVIRKSAEYYGFDGRWLIERNDRARTIHKYEVAREGERRDPFRIGEGPFPLPFGQKRAEILANFKVTLEPFAAGDPPQSDHLRCIPLPGTELATRYSRVDMYIDKRLELPVRLVSENIKDESRIEVDFKDINTDDAPAGSRFIIEEPKDFEVRVESLADKAGSGGPPR